MQQWKQILVCLMLTLGCAGSGCKKDASTLTRLQVFREVELSQTSKELLAKLKLEAEPLHKQLLRHLDQTKSFHWFTDEKKAPKAGYRLRVEMGMLPLPPDRKRKRVRLRWYISYRLTPLESGREVLYIQESRNMSYALKDKLPKREAVAQLFRDLWKHGARSLSTYGKLYLVDSKKLLQSLQRKDLFIKRHATHLLAQRQYKAAIPQLIKQLQTKDPDLLLTTVGALVRLRARAAAVPLIQLARQREGAFLAQILSALAEIGGEEAKGFLFTIASSHNIPAIQQTAREGLQELKQREAKAAQRPSPRRAPAPQ